MTHVNNNKGFTLIELLVVIAIIGILSSVVLSNLTTARSKGNDAAIKAQFAQMRTSAEIYYSNYGTYGGTTTASGFTPVVSSSTCLALGTVFNSTDGIGRLTINAEANSDFSPTWVSTCALGNKNNDSWAISTPLKSGVSWCVDSTGASRAGTSTGGFTSPAICS